MTYNVAYQEAISILVPSCILDRMMCNDRTRIGDLSFSLDFVSNSWS